MLKEPAIKNIYNRIKRERKKNNKDYNWDGCFISHYLQDIENRLLMSFYKFLISKNIKVHSLMYDGLTIERAENYSPELLLEAEEVINTETGYKIKIVEKSTETDWVPTKGERVDINYSAIVPLDTEEFKVEVLNNLYSCCYTEFGKLIDNNCRELVEYLNNFLCMYEEPISFGFRFRKNQNFRVLRKEDVNTVVGASFNKMFLRYENRLKYIKRVFIIDENDPILKTNVYNLYKRPKYIECSEEEFKERCPLFIDFLLRVISDNDNRLYTYLINYLAKIVQVGQTKQCVVLKGKMGTGKSTFGDLVKFIVENEKNEYSCNINDITDMMSRFNALQETCIVTTIEEVITDAGSYHSIQNKLKDIITSETLKIEPKGVDARMSQSQNNLIIITNNINPVEITEDNRRYLIVNVKDYERNNNNYFTNLRKEVNENIEYIRGYLKSYKFEYNLHGIRPITQEELDLRELNMPMEDKFIRDELLLEGAEDNDTRILDDIYNNYKQYCMRNSKKYLTKPLFSKRLKDLGYDTKRIQKDGERRIYLQNIL